MKKRGQIYLIAGIIILSILIGFVSIKTYVKQDNKTYDLTKEFGFESGKVLEFGEVNVLNETEMSELLEHFSAAYSTYAGENTEIIYIFGDENEIKAYVPEEDQNGEVSIGFLGRSTIAIKNKKVSKLDNDKITRKGEKVIVNYNGKEYKFKLKKGYNFYFVIKRKVGEEVYSGRG